MRLAAPRAAFGPATANPHYSIGWKPSGGFAARRATLGPIARFARLLRPAGLAGFVLGPLELRAAAIPLAEFLIHEAAAQWFALFNLRHGFLPGQRDRPASVSEGPARRVNVGRQLDRIGVSHRRRSGDVRLRNAVLPREVILVPQRPDEAEHQRRARE